MAWRRAVLRWLLFGSLALPVMASGLPGRAHADLSEDAAHANTDEARMQGVWDMVENVVNGVRVGEERTRAWMLVIEGDLYNPGSGEISVEYSFRTDPTRTPKAIDLIRTTGVERGRTYRGVYSLEGDTLTVTRSMDHDDDRPAGLNSRAGSNHTRVVWRRRKAR